MSELKRAVAGPDAVEVLVGHKLPGLRSVYTDPAALPMRRAIELIPRLGGATVISIDHARQSVS